MSAPRGRVLRISGVPNARQRQFFASRVRYVAYGGSRGGGKSWALRRKLVAMCLRYPGLKCLIVRRSFGEVKSNHVFPMLREYGELLEYRDSEKTVHFPNKSTVEIGFCASDGDVLRYQGQEFDVIAIDEATQISEYQFSIFKACLRGVNGFPKRMYLTCNPGGIGHAWVKRLFIDKKFKRGEDPRDYEFIGASVYDNEVLMRSDPEYVHALESLPTKMREAWLYGRWDVFEGQFFPEFSERVHVCSACEVPSDLFVYLAADYGFDMLALLCIGVDREGNVYVLEELCRSSLTLSEAALCISEMAKRRGASYLVASPDLWNRRQDTGRSGFEIMQSVLGLMPMIPADDRRIAGWRVVREYLGESLSTPKLRIVRSCSELIRSLPSLVYDSVRAEDASGEPHDITHAPEALRYALMSCRAHMQKSEPECSDFSFGGSKKSAVKNYFY